MWPVSLIQFDLQLFCLNGVQGVGGSNPLAPTNIKSHGD